MDVHSTRYAIARRYMIRLRRDDFDDPHELAKFAATAGMTLQQFREEFRPLIESEPPPLQVGVPGHPNPPEAGDPPAMPPDVLVEPPAMPPAMPTSGFVEGTPSGKVKKK